MFRHLEVWMKVSINLSLLLAGVILQIDRYSIIGTSLCHIDMKRAVWTNDELLSQRFVPQERVEL
jgi:hypothetical protein